MVTIRSSREIELICESSRIVYETLQYLEEKIGPGVTGNELDRLAEDYIVSRDAVPAFKGYMGYSSTLCISINDEVVHGIPSDRKLKDGDIVSVDCGVLKNGYYGDSARTFAIGSISSEMRKLLAVTERALRIGIEAARSGSHVSDIGHTIQGYVEANGFSIVRELVGHGIGIQLHEEPQVPNYGPPGRGIELKTGMCLAIEPMVNLGDKGIYTKSDGWTVCTKDGKPSAHFEHTIAVTEEGGRILSDGVLDG
ncbi:MAG: type I methionyl aminopeptidase [Fidelibacterota bacterium]